MSGDGWPDESGLAGMFDAPAPADSLSSLFGSEAPAEPAAAPVPAPAAEPAPAPAPEPAPVTFAPRTRELPAELALDDILASPAGDLVVDQSPPGWSPPPAPAAPGPDLAGLLAAPPAQPSPEPAPAQWAPPQPAVQPAVQPASPTPGPAPGRGIHDRRLTESGRLWPIVEEVQLVAATDPVLQKKIAALELTRDLDVDARQKQDLYDVLKPAIAKAQVRIVDPRDVPFVLQMAYDEFVGISVLGDLWRDPEITEIMVDRWDKVVIEADGTLQRTAVSFRDPEHANQVARNLALRISDRAVSRSIPLVTAELPQARVTFAYGPVVKGGLSITIRKFRPLIGLDSLISYGSITQEMVDFLHDCIISRAGVLVSGGTGSGKTTIINLLSSFIPANERVLTIEDAFELQLTNEFVLSLQTKEASGLDDTVSITLADLLRNSLRQRPDRIVVGEIREGEGALVMLSAANTGHDGTMTTIHANTADMALNERLVDLVRQVRANSAELSIKRSIASAFELVVQVTRGRGGRRYIAEIACVDKVDESGSIVVTPVFKAVPRPDGTVEFARYPVSPTTSIGQRLADKEVLDRWVTR